MYKLFKGVIDIVKVGVLTFLGMGALSIFIPEVKEIFVKILKFIS